MGTHEETVVDVCASIDNLDEEVKAGYTINAKIVVEKEKEINVVPYEAVMQDENETEYVYVFANGMAVRKDIETGVELTDGVEVLSGVSQDEPIIFTPNKVKKDGTRVKIEN